MNFKWPLSRPKQINDQLNTALGLKLEWGPNATRPLDQRIREAYPELPNSQIKQLAALANEIAGYGFDLWEQAYNKKISANEARAQLKARYPGIDADNSSHLETQGMYFAWHG